MCAMVKTYEWQIGEAQGTVERATMRAALSAAILEFIDSNSPSITENYMSVRIRMREANYRVPQTPGQIAENGEFVAFNHQNKGNAFIRALWDQGYRRVGNPRRARKVDFVLTDHATNSRRGWLDDFAREGVDNFFVYPHTARPNLVNDILPEWPGVTAHFVAAPGHVDVMRAYGYEKPLHVTGWSLCPIMPFRGNGSYRNVLFTPIHERCAEVDRRANQLAFERLMGLVEAGKIHLTVRYYRAEGGSGLAGSGLERYAHPEITYWEIDNLEPDWEQIDDADVVVAHQTYAWMAVARGAPMVMFGQDICPHLVPKSDQDVCAKNWSLYRHLLAYPHDLTGERSTLELLERAAADDSEIVDWRQRMIGEPFDAGAVVSAVEGYL